MPALYHGCRTQNESGALPLSAIDEEKPHETTYLLIRTGRATRQPTQNDDAVPAGCEGINSRCKRFEERVGRFRRFASPACLGCNVWLDQPNAS